MKRDFVLAVVVLIAVLIGIAYTLSLVFPVLGDFCCTSLVFLVLLLAIFMFIWAIIGKD